LWRVVAAFAASFVVGFASVPPALAQSFQSAAPFAFLMDYDSGAALYEKSPDALMSPESMAKLMTAEVVFHELKEGRIKLDDTFEVSENAWRTGGAPARGPATFLALHSKVRVEDLIRGLVIQAGNDAAITLAEGVAGAEESFVTTMNKRATTLGLTHSVFANSWGKPDPRERVTPRELALLLAHIVRDYPEFYRYFGEKEFTWDKVRQLNRNPLLSLDIGADGGVRTGDVAESGYGLVGSAVQNGQRLIVVVNGLKSAADRTEEARKLLQWGFRSFDARTLFQAGEIIGAASVYGGAQGEVSLSSDQPIRVFINHGSDERLTAKIVYQGPLLAPIEKGQQVARLKIWRGQNLILDAPLQTTEDIGVGNLRQRAFDAGFELALSLLRKPFVKN
jgi:serine-type D-Ala-D-Ala carboxypeptidase (penicillin-binding protein 5/6)